MKKRNAAGTGGISDGGANNPPFASYSTTPRGKVQPLRGLMAQAEARMQADPERAGEHFLVWLSCFCALHGDPWPGGEG